MIYLIFWTIKDTRPWTGPGAWLSLMVRNDYFYFLFYRIPQYIYLLFDLLRADISMLIQILIDISDVCFPLKIVTLYLHIKCYEIIGLVGWISIQICSLYLFLYPWKLWVEYSSNKAQKKVQRTHLKDSNFS